MMAIKRQRARDLPPMPSASHEYGPLPARFPPKVSRKKTYEAPKLTPLNSVSGETENDLLKKGIAREGARLSAMATKAEENTSHSLLTALQAQLATARAEAKTYAAICLLYLREPSRTLLNSETETALKLFLLSGGHFES